MVNRLEPVGFRWIESSTAEQILLGWTLDELRQKSFLEMLHPEDRRRAEETFAQALDAGRGPGARRSRADCRTARPARSRSMSVPATARTRKSLIFGAISQTSPTRYARNAPLRLRTLELTRVNEQLRQINRELEELKDRLAQDLTAKRRLEEELRENNQRLARANDELSRANRELDEFVHVVSHDLQEPLRTLDRLFRLSVEETTAIGSKPRARNLCATWSTLPGGCGP